MGITGLPSYDSMPTIASTPSWVIYSVHFLNGAFSGNRGCNGTLHISGD
jgi:hypothetical protein